MNRPVTLSHVAAMIWLAAFVAKHWKTPESSTVAFAILSTLPAVDMLYLHERNDQHHSVIKPSDNFFMSQQILAHYTK